MDEDVVTDDVAPVGDDTPPPPYWSCVCTVHGNELQFHFAAGSELTAMRTQGERAGFAIRAVAMVNRWAQDFVAAAPSKIVTPTREV